MERETKTRASSRLALKRVAGHVNAVTQASKLRELKDTLKGCSAVLQAHVSKKKILDALSKPLGMKPVSKLGKAALGSATKMESQSSKGDPSKSPVSAGGKGESSKSSMSDGSKGDPSKTAAPEMLPITRPRELGTRGRRISLLTNHFKVSWKQSDDFFYHYDVKLKYDDDQPVVGEGVGRKVMKQLREAYSLELAGKEFAYDGWKSLFTVGPLQVKNYVLDVVVDDASSRKIGTSRSPGGDGSPGPSDKKRMKRAAYGKKFKVEISLRGKGSDECNCPDLSTTMVVRPGPVIDFLFFNQNIKDRKIIDWGKAKRALNNLRIKTTHMKAEFKIVGLSEKKCYEQKFSRKQGEGNSTVDVTVYDYFMDRWSIKLDNSADLPCLNVGEPNRPTYLPLERFIRPIKVTTWGVVNFSARCNVSDLIRHLMESARKKGILGGLNSQLKSEINKVIPLVSTISTIIFGMDVSHDSPGRSDVPSVAAVVSSLEWPDISKYRASVCTQAPRLETIDNLFKQVGDDDQGLIRASLLEFYKSSGGKKPEQIVIFRDGVGESQFDDVLNTELAEIIKFLDDKWLPKFTVIVAQKNHHTRFFPHNDNERNPNVQPGTVVDDGICHPSNYDFYMCAHYGMIGTTRPTHYHVLHDEIGFSPDELQELVHSLSYVYQRSTTAISVVAPIYYAHLAAAQVAKFTRLDDMSETSSSHATQAAAAPVPELPRLHDKVASSMFFC
ncbi:hypothetical protein ACQ4PT_046986 [Festuca glaucescens]